MTGKRGQLNPRDQALSLPLARGWDPAQVHRARLAVCTRLGVEAAAEVLAALGIGAEGEDA